MRRWAVFNDRFDGIERSIRRPVVVKLFAPLLGLNVRASIAVSRENAPVRMFKMRLYVCFLAVGIFFLNRVFVPRVHTPVVIPLVL